MLTTTGRRCFLRTSGIVHDGILTLFLLLILYSTFHSIFSRLFEGTRATETHVEEVKNLEKSLFFYEWTTYFFLFDWELPTTPACSFEMWTLLYTSYILSSASFFSLHKTLCSEGLSGTCYRSAVPVSSSTCSWERHQLWRVVRSLHPLISVVVFLFYLFSYASFLVSLLLFVLYFILFYFIFFEWNFFPSSSFTWLPHTHGDGESIHTAGIEEIRWARLVVRPLCRYHCSPLSSAGTLFEAVVCWASRSRAIQRDSHLCFHSLRSAWRVLLYHVVAPSKSVRLRSDQPICFVDLILRKET